MCKQPISIDGMGASEIPIFMESLNSDERTSLIMGFSRNFDDPLKNVLSGFNNSEREEFIYDLMNSLEVNERKMLLESQAFDCLTDEEFEKLQIKILNRPVISVFNRRSL
ncbi:MAG: hypothetical protein PHS16_01065 [Candidatus Colwellbacteria bacterium]|nr:hypothetical protein [Candidatus Colwellbacteria bacterium]MCK9497434.1 hypothetical protein [Candidatus Colwellbacteria bacterium]MDD3752512.1 hypothetical protein [Candidatus Colwellbacteria bacterium]MDD4818856.1 hypothetical protein [Candidatus Colwellbacteria bacterium]